MQRAVISIAFWKRSIVTGLLDIVQQPSFRRRAMGRPGAMFFFGIPLFAALFVIKWNAVFKMASLAPRVEGPRLERPLTAEEVELVHRLDNEDRTLWDSIRDLEEAHRAKPLRSRHAIVTILQIIKDREGLVLPLSSYIDELISQIEEWRRSEPVIWPCAGRVNA